MIALRSKKNIDIHKILKYVIFALCLHSLPLAGQTTMKEYEVKKLAEGVYSFTWKGPLENPMESNSLFVINENDVIVVDACTWPSAAELMIKELKKLTTKPVRYVVNTHWHGDHLHGNSIYKKYWPDVEFIAHEHTRTDYLEQEVKKADTYLQQYKDGSAEYEKWLKEGKDASGKVLDSARRKRVEKVVRFYRELIAEFASVQYLLPDHLITDSLTLYRKDRVIKILWLGNGNTRGDVVLFLPKEKIVATGDLVVYPIPFCFGSYYQEWIETLGRLESLDANVYMPGHGLLLYDKTYIRQIRELLADLVKETEKAAKDGLTLEETQKKVTLPEWRKKFAGDDPNAQQAFDRFVLAPAVERIWHLAKGEKVSE